jgi:hypothetical protein
VTRSSSGFAALVAVALGLASCDERKPISPPADDPDPAHHKGGLDSVTITQIMVAYKAAGGVTTATRTREEARRFAESLLQQIQDGTPMERLLKFSDDLGPDGKPFNDGSYSLARNSPARAAILKAAFDTPVGQVTPKPVDSGLAWHVIRRDR